MSNQVFENQTRTIEILRPRIFDDDTVYTTGSAVAVPIRVASLNLNTDTRYICNVNQYCRLTGAGGQAGFGVQVQYNGGGYNYVAPYILRDSALGNELINNLAFKIDPQTNGGAVDIRIMASVSGGGTFTQDRMTIEVVPNATFI